MICFNLQKNPSTYAIIIREEFFYYEYNIPTSYIYNQITWIMPRARKIEADQMQDNKK